jgi:serine phosphatase RsbU (regulator of sigma subunit)
VTSLRDLVDAVPVGLALLDADLRFVVVNAELARIDGRPATDHAGRHPAEFGPMVDADAVGHVLRTGDPVLDQVAVVPATEHEGRPRQIRTDYVPVVDGNGATVAVAAVVLDSTSGWEAERTFERALEAVLDDVYIARAVPASDAPDGDWVIEHVTSTTRDPFGRDADALVGRRVRELYGTQEAQFLVEHMTAAQRTGRRREVPSMPYRFETGTGYLTTYWDLTFSRLDPDRVVVGTRNVTEAVRAQRSLRASDARLAAERHTIAVLQDALLPAVSGLPDGWAVGWHFESAFEGDPIGGDWYDAFSLRDRRLGVAVGDVAGHGIAAAASMAQLRVLLRSLAFDGDDPSLVLARVGRAAAAFGERLYATCLYAVIDPASGEIAIASAGHPAPIVRTAAGARSLDVAASPPLGVRSRNAHPSVTAVLSPGDTLLAFTDGLVEDREHDIDSRIRDLEAALDELDDLLPDDVAQAVCRRLRPLGGFKDDACVLAVRRVDPM